MKRLEGKVAIVSGGARGQGAAEARVFAAEGARVLVGDVLDDDGAALASEVGDALVYRHLDVTSEDDWAGAVDDVVQRWGRLDALVCNAGISPPPRPFAKTKPEVYRKVVEVNQVGVFLGIRAVIGAMQESGGGSIVVTSSVNGVAGAVEIAPYVSTKFAIRGLVRVAALELGRSGIRVNALLPGPIDTPMIGPESWGGYDPRPMLARSVPLGRIGGPDEVAELACWLASDASAYCTGSDFVIDGGFLAGTLATVPKT
jgi:3alpha(or 20beta)-hydroxysteroid dehydrogenase